MLYVSECMPESKCGAACRISLRASSSAFNLTWHMCKMHLPRSLLQLRTLSWKWHHHSHITQARTSAHRWLWSLPDRGSPSSFASRSKHTHTIPSCPFQVLVLLLSWIGVGHHFPALWVLNLWLSYSKSTLRKWSQMSQSQILCWGPTTRRLTLTASVLPRDTGHIPKCSLYMYGPCSQSLLLWLALGTMNRLLTLPLKTSVSSSLKWRYLQTIP